MTRVVSSNYEYTCICIKNNDNIYTVISDEDTVTINCSDIETLSISNDGKSIVVCVENYQDKKGYSIVLIKNNNQQLIDTSKYKVTEVFVSDNDWDCNYTIIGLRNNKVVLWNNTEQIDNKYFDTINDNIYHIDVYNNIITMATSDTFYVYKYITNNWILLKREYMHTSLDLICHIRSIKINPDTLDIFIVSNDGTTYCKLWVHRLNEIYMYNMKLVNIDRIEISNNYYYILCYIDNKFQIKIANKQNPIIVSDTESKYLESLNIIKTVDYNEHPEDFRYYVYEYLLNF
jgi:hypothetical protein